MDTKGLHHCKHPKKIKATTDNGKHEVFVLPPDLLKKLGISIGNVNVNQEIPTDVSGAPVAESIFNEHEHITNIPVLNCNKNSPDTSILETANLMKKSVFLSPTFVSTVANIIPGEVEISSKNNEEGPTAVTDLVTAQSSHFIPDDSIDYAKLHPESDGALKACHKVDHIDMSCGLPVNGAFTSVSNINENFSQNICLDRNEADVSTIAHENLNIVDKNSDVFLDDGEQSKSTVINVQDLTNKSVKNGDSASLPVKKLTSKINIISEETIPLSKIKKIKRVQSSNRNTLTPVTVNTIIGTEVSNDNIKFKSTGNSEQSSVLPLNNTEMLYTHLDTRSKANIEKSNSKLTENIQAYAAPDKPSQEVQATCSRHSDMALNISENVNSMENKQKFKDNNHLNLVDFSITVGEGTFEKSESSDMKTGYLMENYTNRAIDEIDDVSKHEKYVCGEEGKCINITHVCYNGQHDQDIEPEVNYIRNHEFRKDYVEKPTSVEKESGLGRNNISKDILEPMNMESDSKCIPDAKDILNSDTNADSNSSFLINITNKTDQNDELSNILNVTKELSSSSTNNIKVDKVKEIAAYLKKFSHIYTDKKRLKKGTINSNNNSIKSKLCIQGVEKPGGKDIDTEQAGECKVLKTYMHKHQKKSKSPIYRMHKSGVSGAVDMFDLKMNMNDYSTCKRQEFCLCYDFGRLAYYDNDSLYEHIHFWQHNKTNCELDLIFAIYSDEVISSYNESGSDQEEKAEEKEESYNFCSNVFQNDLAENVDISDQEQIQHDYLIDELNDACFGENLIVPELNLAEPGNNSIASEIDNSADMMINNKNSGIILESVDHDIFDSAESKNCDTTKRLQNNNSKCFNSIYPAVVTTVETADIENKDTTFESLDSKLMLSDKSSRARQENASNTKENTHEQHLDSQSNIIKIPKEEVKLDLPKTKENIALKRSFSRKTAPENSNNEPSLKKNIKCGLCNNLFSETDWEEHVTDQHDLIAWKAGYTINLDHPDLLNKLNLRLKLKGVLKCSICNMETKKLKKFIEHVKYCIKQKNTGFNKNTENQTRKSRTTIIEHVTCGVCQQTVQSTNWLEHIGREHNYLAWSIGQEVLNLLDDAMVWQHLQNIIRLNGSLTCYKCGLNRSRVKSYLSHLQTCDGSRSFLDDSMSVDLNSTSNLEDRNVEKPAEDKIVKCGVCKQDVTHLKWIEHIAKEHNYLAWQDGATPLNLDEEEAVWNHLQQFIRQKGGLFCYKCGLNRRRVKLYLAHIETCDGAGVSIDDLSVSIDLNSTNTLDSLDKSSRSANDEKMVECGVCKQKVSNSKWVEHIGKEHNYLAWRDGDVPLDLDNEEAVWLHLQQIIRYNDGLICYKCGLHRKRVKLYLSHVKTCDGSESLGDISTNNISLDSTSRPGDQWFEVPIESEESKIVKCGVCSQETSFSEWIQHIGKEHSYLAWQDGAEPLNLEDESAIRLHLLNISRHNSGLICNKCEKNIKYPKTFLQHIKECSGVVVSFDNSRNDSANISDLSFNIKNIKTETVTCGVCEKTIDTPDWMNHFQNDHQYLAWIDGQPPLDVNDAAVVQRHLNEVSKMLGGLTCLKCGVRRKYVKTYLQHVDTCDGSKCTGELTADLIIKDVVECAVCAEKLEPRDWRDHAMKKHYNIAWAVGDKPIELNNPYAVESYLKEYHRRHNKLVCKVCGISRVSYVGFYAHIIICGKTEEETEMYKSVCDICHNKYLRIYKSQHMTAHREQEYALERKLLVAKEKELKKEEPADIIQTGRRKAAEKAKTVIEKYKNSFHDGAYHCSKCGFSAEIEKELSDHVCVEDNWGDATDSDESVNLEHCSDDDSDDTDIDSNVSDEEREAREQDSHKKKRYSDTTCSAKIIRLPFPIENINKYMKRSTEEFAQKYLTDEDLFTKWHSCEIEVLPDDEVLKYMPPIEESCKVRFDETKNWFSCSRFESKRERDKTIMFVGASIQCISWAPAHVDGEVSSVQPQYLAVTGHLGADVPRFVWDESPAGRGLIQIWDLGNMIASMPQFVLGLAHDYGTVWAIDWCPSGTRDVFDFIPEPGQVHRLGLLAAACSNGSAYIFLVPYPSSLPEKDKLFYKIKPVVELRLVMNADRKSYQATAIKWSMQKGHSHVVVGYSDGTTAFYDLNGESPLLRTTENNITVFYPYHDERVQNSCIEDMDMYPSGAGPSARAGGAVCVGGAGGAGVGTLQSHVAAARVLFPPHWPAALLAGDDCLVNQSINEVEWWGGGRRLGGMRGAAGCTWCGRVAAASLPLLRVMRLHPCFPEVHKKVIGAIQMAHLGSKRKRQTDELAMIVEPITYTDAVNKYGIEFKQIVATDRTTQQRLSAMPRDAYPERFPLSDVTAMQFCPTFRHHHKLALAVHAGIVFIINV